MLRGVMVLSQQEIAEAVAVIEAKYSDTPLHHKLTSSAQASVSEASVQVSNEELEILLDNLGVPAEGESDAKKRLRLNVQKFLAKLRHVE